MSPRNVTKLSGFEITYFTDIVGLGSLVAANWLSLERPGEASTTRVVTTTSLSHAPCKATQEVMHL
ncbi:hypothetical protein GGP41_004406 [Bipolaris sorokiniana]|uniref:Uncharacterized protein n=1 Tax=Cochliobolus sativus TaxID=45130 RepID=A0A8H6DYW4_COCSA|nr:hypothetical protein GGP41_004406 [Bipolaris sorokiniana]